MTKDLEKLKLEEYNRFSSLLEDIHHFIENHQFLTYIEFDYYVVHEVILFSIEPDFDFDQLGQTLHQLKKALPAIKRILNKPIIVLRDTEDVLPVENARIINQNTLLHLANHGQYVANITNKGVKPRKLLTRIYEDEYSIYENIIFCNFVDEILSIINKNRRILNSIYYASNIIRFNILEKGNHMNYFLALGKLHTGYIRDFSQYFNLSKELLNELSHIFKTISPRLYKPVYKKNANRNKNLALKKTNIFLMQKDYRQVYKTYKHLLGNKSQVNEDKQVIDFETTKTNYLKYIEILTIFAIGHFNFETDPQTKMDLDNLNLVFTFKGWKLEVKNNLKKEIILYFTKEDTYGIMLTNTVYEAETILELKNEYALDEVVVVNQFDEDYLERNDVFISMEDIDSFRRIQQIVLRGMIYSDKKRNVCPFCGGKLHKDSYQNMVQCGDCMIQIHEKECHETGVNYYCTDISNHKKHTIHKSDFKEDDYWYYEKQIESLMYFRNITKINQNSEIVCPRCGKVHE